MASNARDFTWPNTNRQSGVGDLAELKLTLSVAELETAVGLSGLKRYHVYLRCLKNQDFDGFILQHVASYVT